MLTIRREGRKISPVLVVPLPISLPALSLLWPRVRTGLLCLFRSWFIWFADAVTLLAPHGLTLPKATWVERPVLCNSSLAAWPSGLSWGIKTWQRKRRECANEAGEGLLLFLLQPRHLICENPGSSYLFIFGFLGLICTDGHSFLLLGFCTVRCSVYPEPEEPTFLCVSMHPFAWGTFLYGSFWDFIIQFLEPLPSSYRTLDIKETVLLPKRWNVCELVCWWVHFCEHVCACVLMWVCVCKVWASAEDEETCFHNQTILSASIVCACLGTGVRLWWERMGNQYSRPLEVMPSHRHRVLRTVFLAGWYTSPLGVCLPSRKDLLLPFLLSESCTKMPRVLRSHFSFFPSHMGGIWCQNLQGN